MAGHSKWANIKHRKGAQDAKRGKIFSKIAKEISVCARVGGGNPEDNPTLRTLIQKGRSANMPADNIDRAIKKGTGELDDGLVYEELVYEGYGPAGVGLIVKVLTDNKNRSASDLRHCFTKSGYTMAQQGAVSHAFQRKGLITLTADAATEDQLFELTLEAGAEEIEQDDGSWSITTDPGQFMNVVDALTHAGVEIQGSELTMLPDNYLPVTGKEHAKQLLAFLEKLDDLEDVQDVYNNADIDDVVLAELTGD
jgi:YebC/PmpR family DNA-binding regulatory protein